MEKERNAVLDLARIAGMRSGAVHDALRTGPDGLSTDEANLRLRVHGLNELPAARKVGVSRKFLIQLRNLFNVLLLFASILSFLVGVGFGDQGSVQMGFAILAVVLFNAAFSVVQEFRAERTVEALRRLIPANAKVIRDGRKSELPVSQLVPGDVITIEQGEHVPADARLIGAFGVDVDHSTLTGESDPRPRTADPVAAASSGNVTDLPNLVFAGTTVASGFGTAVVIATGARTRFGAIVERTRGVRDEASPLQKQMDHSARTNFIVSLVVGLIFLAIAIGARGIHPLVALLFMIGVMISLVPEGLQLTVTLSLALSSLSMAKAKVIAKRLASVEALGSATVICTDKTGTVTTGQMTVRKLWLGGKMLDVTGEGFGPEGSVKVGGKRILAANLPELNMACEVAILNNQSSLVPPLDRTGRRWTAVGDTTEAALLAFAIKAGADSKTLAENHPRIGMVPFDSTRKMMTTVNQTPEGLIAYAKGAAREVLAKCTSKISATGKESLTLEGRKEIDQQIDSLARQAYRVLALAYRTLPAEPPAYSSELVETDLVFIGLTAIYDPPRPEAVEAVRTARKAGIRVMMLTGDHELTAEAIARQVGLFTHGSQPVITGARLAAMSDHELSEVVDAPEAVFARITPEQKHRVVQALKARGEIVAVTGDGVNDAPALAEADIGIAMGISGTDVAREAADMILLDDNFASIVKGVEVGRGVFDNLRKFIAYVFTHNWAELVSFVAFVLLGVPIALSVIGVIAIDLVMEIPISLALTLEPPGPQIMARMPRPYGSRLFDREAILVSLYLGVILGIGALLGAFAVWSQGGWSYGMDHVPDGAAYVRGSTLLVAGIMLGQVGNYLARRADPRSAFSMSPLRNRWFFPGILGALGLLLLIVYVPPLESLFGTSPLGLKDWLLIIPLLLLTLAVEETRKAISRRLTPIRAEMAPRAAPVQAPIPPPIPSAEETGRPKKRLPSWTRDPIVLPLFLRSGDRAAISLVMRIAAVAGSEVTVVPINRAGDPRQLAEEEQAIGHMAAQAGIRVDYARLSRAEMPSQPRDIAEAIASVAARRPAGAIVLAAEKSRFSRSSLGRLAEHLASLTKAKIIYVCPPQRPLQAWPKLVRFLIPVLEDFHQEPFEVADILTRGQAVPNVDVVVARVIRIPPIVPLYSTYTPESLVDADHEMSVLQRLVRGRTRVSQTKILLVRNVSRDLIDFASDRQVDAIILWGDRNASPRMLREDEEGLLRNASCLVLVVLSGEAEESAEEYPIKDGNPSID